MLRQPKVTFIPNNIRSLGIVQIRVRRYKSCSLTILLGECSNVGIVNGTIKEDDSLATQAHLYTICGTQCAAYLKMAMWEICGLADGRIVGPGYGGAIESSNADGVVGCWVVCKGNIINSYQHYGQFIEKKRRYIFKINFFKIRNSERMLSN